MLFHWCTKDNKENAIKLKSICPLPLNSNKNNNVLFLKQKSPYTPTYGYFECLSGYFGGVFSHSLNSPLEHISFEA
jgi:hypothetical protein